MTKLRVVCSLGLMLLAAPALFAQKAPAPSTTMPKGAHPKSKEEKDALNALTALYKNPATTGDQLDAALNDFVTKFPTSDYLATVATWGLQFYQTPPHADYAKSLVYGEQAIKADPKSLYALATLGDIIPTQVKDTDLDADQRLKEATDDDNAAIQIAQTGGSTINGQPFTDAQKQKLQAIAYTSLARIANIHKDYPNVVANYQKALPFDDAGHQAVDDFYMARAYITMKKWTEANAALDAALKLAPTDPNVQAAVASNKKFIAAQQAAGGGGGI
ncbi:MAG TPA: hypothetical protein VN515_10720 [Terriglobales bacterium]|nr:hypothetical protein [Terriglobales bacterium]